MIASLRGTLQSANSERLVIDVQGVGYEVLTCLSGSAPPPAVGEETFLHVHTAVREDAITLFGFFQREEKELFLLLINVSGIGPKLALNILTASRPVDLASAIVEEDLGRLTRIPGVGKKTAERLCLELKDKVRALSFQAESAAVPADSLADPVSLDVISALVNLGYPPVKAREALKNLRLQHPDDLATMPIAEALRLALRSLA